MAYLLHIDVSPMGENSFSRKVGAAFIEAYKESHPEIEVKYRDLNANPVPHLDGEALTAGYVPEDARPPSMQAKHQLRLDLVKEISEATAILVSTPMWNWNTPSVLKAYIDQIILVGALDPYSNKHLAGKPVTIAIACGGGYGEGSWHPEWDYESGYLKQVFTLLGATDIEVIRSEYCLAGVVPGMEGLIEKKEQSHADAKEAVRTRAKNI